MLVKYIYEAVPRVEVHGDNVTISMDGKQPVAVIVATSPNNVGIAVCNPKDTFNKRFARNIAAARALRGFSNEEILNREFVHNGSKHKWVPNRVITPLHSDQTVSLYDEVKFRLEQIRDRATKYFAQDIPLN